MKNYMLVATAISFIGVGTLFGDYYPHTSQYAPSQQEYKQPYLYNSPNHQHYHGSNISYSQDIDQTQPYNTSHYHGYNNAEYGDHTHYFSQETMPSEQGQSLTSPGNFTTDPRSNIQGMRPVNGQSTVNGAAQMNNQGIVKSNDNDKFTTDDDRRLGFQIRQQIAEKHPNVDLNSLALYVDDGSVRITGKVRTEQEKVALSNLIKELKGVKSVNNKLEAQNGTSNGNSPLALNDTKYPSTLNGQKTNNMPNGTTATSQDSMLADKIRQTIAADNTLSPQAKSIGIVVNSKTITLNGTVKNEGEKSRIATKVRNMSEGRVVNNMLEVNHAQSRPAVVR